jgi:hypothetical protein
MSAIGSYVRIRTTDLDRCLELAAPASSEGKFRWPWQPRAETGRERFTREWEAAVLEEVDFDGSGYVLASYFLAQGALNGLDDPFESPEADRLANVFTAALPVRVRRVFPELDANGLREFCATEWGADAPGMHAAILKAHEFFRAGMSRVTSEEAVVFIIS